MDNLKLRHIQIEDYNAIRRYATSALVTKYLTWKPHQSTDETNQYFQHILKAVSSPDETLAIEYKGLVIGTVHFISRGNGRTQFGFGILPAYWHQGLGTVATEMVLKYFRRSKWRKLNPILLADVYTDNQYAIRILKKLKFHLSPKEVKKNRDRYIMADKR